MDGTIPVIDLKEKTDESQKVLREACKKWGCFRVVNHGVPAELMAEVKSVAIDLFHRPMEIKQRRVEVLIGSGYMAPSEKNPHYEAFGIHDVATPGVLSSFCSDLQVSPHQREILETYVTATQKLALNVAHKMAATMDLADYSFEDWQFAFRMNKYNFTEDGIAKGSCGIGMHTDSGLITILQDDENLKGLEVENPSTGTFVAVSPLPGAFFVNLGDMAVPLSNGEMQSVRHRVQGKEAGTRLSIVTFLGPSPDKIIEVPPKLIDADHPPRYAPFNCAEFRKIRASQMHDGHQALKMVRNLGE